MTSRQSDAARPVALVVGGVSLALFALTACRTVAFGDSGELIAASASLGVAHPPGYPLYTLLGRGALAWPFGEPALAMNLMSALFGAAACGSLAWLATRLAHSTAAGLAAGGALAVASPFWAVATVAEVYTLHVALVVAVLCTAAWTGSAKSTLTAGRATIGAGCLLGAALAHRPTIVLALPAAWWIWRTCGGRFPGRRVVVAAAGLALALPAMLYGSLMLRARAAPAVNWGETVDLPRLIAHVATRGYGHYRVGPAGWVSGRTWESLAEVVVTALTPIGAFLALAGLTGVAAEAARRRTSLRLRAVPWLLAIPTAGFAMTYATPDVEVLYLPVVAALCLAAGFGVGDLAARLPAGRRRYAGVVVAMALAALALARGSSLDRSSMTAARDYAEDMLAGVPEGAALFVEGDDAFLLAYQTQVRGIRPDLTLYDRKGVLFRDQAREPGSPPRSGESGPAYRVRREIEFALAAVREAPPRPVMFMTWPGYELPAGLRFEPEGLWYRVRRADEPPARVAGVWEGYREGRVVDQAQRSGELQARTVAATYALMRGERARFEGDRGAALEAFDRAGELARGGESIPNYLGTVFGRMGDYERATREFERALDALPVSVRAWNNLALARSLAGDTEGARAAWQRSLELRPGQVEVQQQLRRIER